MSAGSMWWMLLGASTVYVVAALSVPDIWKNDAEEGGCDLRKAFQIFRNIQVLLCMVFFTIALILSIKAWFIPG